MMLYVYGIVEAAGFETIPGEGHEAGDVVALPCGAFAAAVSRVSASGIEVTPQNVWRHERVLERLMQDRAVLPLRFGTICRDEEALRECLPDSADGFRSDLERVRGRVEMALRVVDHAPSRPVAAAGADMVPATAAGRGAAYLRARLRGLHGDAAREAAAGRMKQILRRALDGVVTDLVCSPPTNDTAYYRASCLVERGRVAAFADALDDFRAGHRRFDVTCSGPWAPYSFATGGM